MNTTINLRRFIETKLAFANSQKEESLIVRDGTYVYWCGVIDTCQDILKLIN